MMSLWNPTNPTENVTLGFIDFLLLCATILIYSKFTLKCQEQEKIVDSVI